MVTIAHISDPHVGSPYFVPNLMNRAIVELNELAPGGFMNHVSPGKGPAVSIRPLGIENMCG